jgi:hypothetical protein
MLVPITMAVGMDVRLPGMPETAIAGAPGVRIWVPATMSAVGVVREDDVGAGV